MAPSDQFLLFVFLTKEHTRSRNQQRQYSAFNDAWIDAHLEKNARANPRERGRDMACFSCFFFFFSRECDERNIQNSKKERKTATVKKKNKGELSPRFFLASKIMLATRTMGERCDALSERQGETDRLPRRRERKRYRKQTQIGRRRQNADSTSPSRSTSLSLCPFKTHAHQQMQPSGQPSVRD